MPQLGVRLAPRLRATNRGNRSSISLGTTISFESGGELESGQTATQAPGLTHRPNPYGLVLKGEVHLAREEAQAIAHRLGDDDLALGSHSRSHTHE
jgi:hypothetical protein